MLYAEDVCMLYVAEDVYAVCCGGSVPSIWVYDAEDMGRMRGWWCMLLKRERDTHTHYKHTHYLYIAEIGQQR